MIRKTYKIPTMHCTSCVMNLEALEDALPGIRFIEASYRKQTLIVEFDEAQVSEAQIHQAVRALHHEIE
jgi:copper chaperone CopZ